MVEEIANNVVTRRPRPEAGAFDRFLHPDDSHSMSLLRAFVSDRSAGVHRNSRASKPLLDSDRKLSNNQVTNEP